MLRSLILIALSLNIAFAKTRFTEVEKKNLKESIKKDISGLKKKNKTESVTLEMIKADFDRILISLKDGEKANSAESEDLQKKFDAFKSSASTANLEQNYNKFIDDQIKELERKPLEKTKEGKVCNSWGCDEGLTCAISLKEEESRSCKEGLKECNEDKDCCSLKCNSDSKTKKKTCEKVSRCFRPVALGQSCAENPVCVSGACLPYNSETSGIGECSVKGKECKKNSECCSNSCVSNKCVDSFVCKDCAKDGAKPRGKKCCEGLYLDEEGRCVPDAPPAVLPQVRVRPQLKILDTFVALFISNASATEGATYAEKAKNAADAAKAAQDNADASAAEAQRLRNEADDLATQLASAKTQCEEDKKHCSGDVCHPHSCTQVTSLTKQWNTTHKKQLEAEAKVAKDAETAKALKLEAGIAADNANASSAAGQAAMAKQLESAAPVINLTRTSDFNTCNIRVRDDFFKQLQKTPNPGGQGNLLDLETAMLAFDFVLLSEEGINDYWLTTTTDPKTSLYGRLKAIAVEHRAQRKETNKKIDTLNERLTCMCIDAQGMNNPKITKDKKEFFKAKCAEYATLSLAGENGAATASTGASGIKGKRLIVHWTQTLQDFNATLAINNSNAFNKINDVLNWVKLQNNSDWGGTSTRPNTLFGWSTKVSGGFFGSFFNAFFTMIGFFGEADSRGYNDPTSPEMILKSAMNGAWFTGNPTISDRNNGSTDCDAYTATCTSYTRALHQPYNDVCKYNISSHACVKNFIIYDDGHQSKYIIDPWIPLNVKKETILGVNAGSDYAKKLDDSFARTFPFMQALNLGEQGNYDSVDNQRFFERRVVDSYFSDISKNKSDYLLKADAIKEIKAKARQFAIDEQFFQEGDSENLAAFGDYAFNYHFIYPKTSYVNQISYPTVGLSSYLIFMTNGVAGNLSIGNLGAVKTFGNLNEKYLQDYLKTLMLYRDQAINQADKTALVKIDGEMAWAQKQLNNQVTLNACMGDTKLTSYDPATINSIARTAGVSEVNLSGSDMGVLNAVGKLRQVRQDQLKKLDFYNKAMAASGNPERVAQVAEAAKSFAGNFTSPVSGAHGGGNLLGGNVADALGPKTAAIGTSKKKSDLPKYDMNFGGASSSGGSRSSSKPAVDNKTESHDNSELDEDAKKLADAISARDKSNKAKYTSNDEMSLFEKVTNAYIRNYDRILETRKKANDSVEPQQ